VKDPVRLGNHPAHADERAGAPPRRSLWLLDALDGDLLTPPLAGAGRADVAIVGGGYVGLWTAIELKERDASLDVVVLEADVCGGGASGRNGGHVHTWWDRLANLIAVCGEEEALRLARASEDALDELERLGEEIELRRDGWVWTATTPAQLGAWERTVALAERHRPGTYERLDAGEVRAHAHSDVHLAGVREPRAGTVHPGRLVRALRRIALQAGVRVHEHTPVVAIGSGAAPIVRTPSGQVTAARVVLATGAWAAAVPELARRLFVVGSDVVATRRIPERLVETGWTGGQALCDSQARVLYYRRTADGRVVFGRGGGNIALGGRIGPRFDYSARFARDATASFRRVYPMLADVPVDLAWAGPVDRTVSHLPIFGRLQAQPAVIYGVGWSGTGVAQSRIGARILASLALDADDEWSGSRLVDQPEHRFPPDPIRFVGAHLVHAAVTRQGRAQERGRRPDLVTRGLASLVPELDT
jgi:glycine/D-amino acid oxidase-like deaminating enzyme